MPDNAVPARTAEDSTFDRLLAAQADATPTTTFATAFRGYDKDEVDTAVAELEARARSTAEQLSALKQNQRRASAVVAQTREKIAALEIELEAANRERNEAVDRLASAVTTATAESRDAVAALEAELAAARARASASEQRVQALTEELVGATDDTPNGQQFEEILRVAEEQANVLLRNATVQGERLLEAARAEIESRRKDAQAEADAILSQAQHEAQQVRLRIDTELTAHRSTIEREAAHAAEKVSQAEREAAAIRTEAEKGAAALRSMVARETAEARAEAEEAVRELRVRALDFEASLTRRQDDAQQEFLVLHNQAVAHAERITQDANEQVAASLDHAQRVSAKAEDFERLMRAQAQQIEADAHLRAREQLDQARVKAQRIIDLVTTQAQTVLRDAEDRTRQLRWQQHQLMSFMAEVKEMIRPDAPIAAAQPADLAEVAGQAPIEVVVAPEDVDAEHEELTEAALDAEPGEVETVEAEAVEPGEVESDEPEVVEPVSDGDVDEAEIGEEQHAEASVDDVRVEELEPSEK